MKDLFFTHIKTFVVVIIFYFVLYKTIFSCLLKQESGFQNIYAIILTAVIMTIFELGFIWINYYYAFNNSASYMIYESASENVKDGKIPKAVIDSVLDILSGPATVDNKKISTINSFATTAGILLVSILILILVVIDAKGKGQGYSTNPRVIFASIATAISLVIFFGFFYFSTTSVYKMMPNDMDMIKSVKNVLENDVEAPEDIPVRNIVPNDLNNTMIMLIILLFVIFIGGKYIFPKFQNLCKKTV